MQIDYLLNLHNRAATTGAAWTGPREILGDDRESYPPSDGRDATHLDYCFVSPSFAGRVRSSHVDREADGSDHKPVWVDIDLSTGGLP